MKIRDSIEFICHKDAGKYYIDLYGIQRYELTIDKFMNERQMLECFDLIDKWFDYIHDWKKVPMFEMEQLYLNDLVYEMNLQRIVSGESSPYYLFTLTRRPEIKYSPGFAVKNPEAAEELIRDKYSYRVGMFLIKEGSWITSVYTNEKSIGSLDFEVDGDKVFINANIPPIVAPQRVETKFPADFIGQDQILPMNVFYLTVENDDPKETTFIQKGYVSEYKSWYGRLFVPSCSVGNDCICSTTLYVTNWISKIDGEYPLEIRCDQLIGNRRSRVVFKNEG